MITRYSALTYIEKLDNIGDFIQTVAAMEFLPKVDYFVERENMFRSSSKPPSFLVANGWYMHNPQHFPPPANISPFYISIHIDCPSMLTPEAVAHFKEHEPIGCRDRYTFELLKAKEVSVYLSDCLSLALKNRFTKRTSGVYMVDVDESFMAEIPEAIKNKAVHLSHNIRFKKLWGPIKRCWPDLATSLMLKAARAHLDLYARAKLVVTSRLHCYFPCLAFRMPVIFLLPSKPVSSHRFDNMERYSNFYSCDYKKKIDWEPATVDITAKADFLTKLTRKAVDIKDNPLKHFGIEYFCGSAFRPETGNVK